MEYDALSFKIGIAMGHISQARCFPQGGPVAPSDPIIYKWEDFGSSDNTFGGSYEVGELPLSFSKTKTVPNGGGTTIRGTLNLHTKDGPFTIPAGTKIDLTIYRPEWGCSEDGLGSLPSTYDGHKFNVNFIGMLANGDSVGTYLCYDQDADNVYASTYPLTGQGSFGHDLFREPIYDESNQIIGIHARGTTAEYISEVYLEFELGAYSGIKGERTYYCTYTFPSDPLTLKVYPQ